MNSLQREGPGSASAGLNTARWLLVAQITNLATCRVRCAFGTSEAAVRIENGAGCAAVVVRDLIDVETVA